MGRKPFSQEEIIKKFKEIHGNRYDYSKVKYINNRTKVCIICPKHGEFWQTPAAHLKGQGCRKCFFETIKMSQEEFIHKSIEIHGDKYDYSKTVYVNAETKVCIICHKKDILGREHGEFWIKPFEHIQRYHTGCSKCKGFHCTTEEFIQKAKKVHGDKYDYSKVEYKGSHKVVTIICPIHGEFEQVAKEHLKYGCKYCAKEDSIQRFIDKKLTTEEFIHRAQKVHGNHYDYSKVEYNGYDNEVCIICPIHGEFWQTPHTHLDEHICPFCASEKNISENKLLNMLKNIFKNEKITPQKRFKWLRNIKPMPLDMFFENRNIAIEYQGAQHFMPINFSGKNEEAVLNDYNNLIERDILKIKLCSEHNIKLLHFSFTDKFIPKDFKNYKVITNFDELLNEIKNGEYTNS